MPIDPSDLLEVNDVPSAIREIVQRIEDDDCRAIEDFLRKKFPDSADKAIACALAVVAKIIVDPFRDEKLEGFTQQLYSNTVQVYMSVFISFMASYAKAMPSPEPFECPPQKH